MIFPKDSQGKRKRTARGVPGFTLIELLIVVAIIAILAAIAVPNFLEAQTRAKVSRVKADLRTLGVAMEAYCVDENEYPPNNGLNAADPLGMTFNFMGALALLSTPVAYISSAHLKDPFAKPDPPITTGIYPYVRLHPSEGLFTVLYPMAGVTPQQSERAAGLRWYIFSVGPDGKSANRQFFEQLGNQQAAFMATIQDFVQGGRPYDPTNGTVSIGEITLTGKGFLDGTF